jgi:hypothetical protein
MSTLFLEVPPVEDVVLIAYGHDTERQELVDRLTHVRSMRVHLQLYWLKASYTSSLRPHTRLALGLTHVRSVRVHLQLY